MHKVDIEWKKSGLSTSDLDKSFTNFEAWNNEVKSMKDTATNYYLRFDKIQDTKCNSIILAGNPGCGKTHLSLALANNLLKKKGKKVLYISYVKAILEIKQNTVNQDQYKALMDKYKTVEVLFIDDFLKGKTTEFDINVLFEIIDYRYINKKPMIISTERCIDEILDFDQAIGSRLWDMSRDHYKFIEGKENNYRIRGIKNEK